MSDHAHTVIPDAAVDALTGALATASGVPGATAGDCYRAGLAAALPHLDEATILQIPAARAMLTEANRAGRVSEKHHIWKLWFDAEDPSAFSAYLNRNTLGNGTPESDDDE